MYPELILSFQILTRSPYRQCNYVKGNRVVMLGPSALGYREGSNIEKVNIIESPEIWPEKRNFFPVYNLSNSLRRGLMKFIPILAYLSTPFYASAAKYKQSKGSTEIHSTSGKISQHAAKSTARNSPKGSSKNERANKYGEQNKKVKVEVKVQKEFVSKDKLTKVGLLLVGGTVVGTLLLPNDNASLRRRKRASSKDYIGLTTPQEGEGVAPKATTSFSTSKISPKRPIAKPLRAALENSIPTPKGSSIDSEKSSNLSSGEDKNYSRTKVAEDLFDLEHDEALIASESSSLDSNEKVTSDSVSSDTVTPPRDEEVEKEKLHPPPKPVPASAPIEKKKGGGILDRLFTNLGGGSGRPQKISDAIAIVDDKAAFRAKVAATLYAKLPSELQSLYPSMDAYRDLSAKEVDELAALWRSLGLAPIAAAEAFADVVTALLTSLVDKAVDTLSVKSKKMAEGSA